jgi:hypothetical protein
MQVPPADLRSGMAPQGRAGSNSGVTRKSGSLRRHGAKEALLVGWCIASDGRKHLLHLAVGNKESQACWTEFFSQHA